MSQAEQTPPVRSSAFESFVENAARHMVDAIGCGCLILGQGLLSAISPEDE
jgi:hypothetical protein